MAEELLEGSDENAKLLERLRSTCAPLVSDHDFWQKRSQGLAVLCDAENVQFVDLPFAPQEGVFLGRRFQVKPLLRLTDRDRLFFVLAVSAGRCRLFRGDRRGLERIRLEDLPDSLEEALRYDDPEQSLQLHTGAGPAGGERAAIFHGQGGAKDDSQDRLERYGKLVAKAVSAYLKDPEISQHGKARLYLACVDDRAALLRSAIDYEGLAEELHIAGNPDDATPQELHEKAWSLVEQDVAQSVRLPEDLDEKLAHDRASTDLREIAKAVQRGRVDRIFVAEDKTVCGAVDPAGGVVADSDDGADILNELAAATIWMGGEAHVLPADQIPGSSGVAALYRF